jgi:hypothetical protein
MDKRLKGRLTAAQTTKPAPEDFYASLADEQEAWLNTPTATLRGGNVSNPSTGSALGADEVSASCVLRAISAVRTRFSGRGRDMRRCRG